MPWKSRIEHFEWKRCRNFIFSLSLSLLFKNFVVFIHVLFPVRCFFSCSACAKYNLILCSMVPWFLVFNAVDLRVNLIEFHAFRWWWQAPFTYASLININLNRHFTVYLFLPCQHLNKDVPESANFTFKVKLNFNDFGSECVPYLPWIRWHYSSFSHYIRSIFDRLFSISEAFTLGLLSVYII